MERQNSDAEVQNKGMQRCVASTCGRREGGKAVPLWTARHRGGALFIPSPPSPQRRADSPGHPRGHLCGATAAWREGRYAESQSAVRRARQRRCTACCMALALLHCGGSLFSVCVRAFCFSGTHSAAGCRRATTGPLCWRHL